MMTGFLLIVGVYGFCAACIHLLHAVQKRTERNRTVHLAVVTRNQEPTIEWYLRSYLFVSWLKGRQTTITVFDDGSDDATVEIVRRLAKERPQISLELTADGLDRFLDERRDQRVLLARLDKPDSAPAGNLQL